MNYYECIHNSIKYLENNLLSPIILENIAAKSGMSLTNFYRMFYSMTGYTVKDYIRRRRICHASKLLVNSNMRIIDISIECQYESQEAFTRAYKQLVGYTPKVSKDLKKFYTFERIDIMDTYFEIQDDTLLEKYPDIKVLKNIEPVRVAYYRTYSQNPENDSFKVLHEWAEKNNLLGNDAKYRIFGYDTPDFKPGDTEYGYEVWMTIDKGLKVKDDKIKTKTFKGGMYAVTSTKIKDIVNTWDRFREWLKISKYGLGEHQYLEEHLPFDLWKNNEAQGENKIDLYMPIKEEKDISYEEINPVKVAYYRASGSDNAPYEAWDIILEWANKNNFFTETPKHKFFAYHNRKRGKNFWYEVMVTVDDDFVINDEKVEEKLFSAGIYATISTNFKKLPKSWKEIQRWRDITNTQLGTHQWLEEWFVHNGKMPTNPDIKVYLPIQK